jgi:hypothetical protein
LVIFKANLSNTLQQPPKHMFDDQPRLRSRNRRFGGNDGRGSSVRYGALVRPRIGVVRSYNE